MKTPFELGRGFIQSPALLFYYSLKGYECDDLTVSINWVKSAIFVSAAAAAVAAAAAAAS